MPYINSTSSPTQNRVSFSVSLAKSSFKTVSAYSGVPVPPNVSYQYLCPFYWIGPFFIYPRVTTATNPNPNYNGWVVSFTAPDNTHQEFVYPLNTKYISITVKQTGDYKELFSIRNDRVPEYAWRSKLYHSAPSQVLDVTYQDSAEYEIYINGSLAFATTFDGASSIDQYAYKNIFSNITCITGGSGSYYTEVDTTATSSYRTYPTPITNVIRGDFYIPSGTYQISKTFTDLSYGDRTHTYAAEFSPTLYKFTSDFEDGITVDNAKKVHITTPPKDSYLYYRYKIDDPHEQNPPYPHPLLSMGHFKAEEIITQGTWDPSKPPEEQDFEPPTYFEWNGTTSPYQLFTKNSQFTLTFPSRESVDSFRVRDYDHCLQSSDPETGYARFVVSNNKPFPHRVGNVICTNPEDINNYTLRSTKDAHGLEEGDERNGISFDPDTCTQVRNQELQISLDSFIPGDFRADLLHIYPQIFANNNHWQYVNCEKRDGYVVPTASNAYIYQDFYRPKYAEEKDPNGLLHNTPYRQRHSTHLRFLEHSFQYEVEDPDTHELVFRPFNPDLKLIYKPFGDYNSGHTWTAKYNLIYKAYDLLKCNSGIGVSDECLSTIQPEDYKLYDESAERGDEGWGITYLNEPPQTNPGYLPNVVGRIEISIPAQTRVQTSDISSLISPTISQDQLTLRWHYTEAVQFIFDRQILPPPSIGQVTNYYLSDPEAPDSSAEFYSINTLNYDLARIELQFDNETPFTVTSDSWVSTLPSPKRSKLTVHFYFAPKNSSDTIHAYQTVFLDEDCQSFFRYRLHNEFNNHGIELAYAEWFINGTPYSFDAFHTLQLKLNEYYSKEIPLNELAFLTGREFIEMTYVGEHEPKPAEDESANSFDCYESRFATLAVNGARCGDFPDVLRIRNPHLMMSELKTLTLNYNNTGLSSLSNKCPVIFPRDDLGEVVLNLEEYEPDEDGYVSTKALYNSKVVNIHYLRSTYDIIKGNYSLCVYSNPEVDSITSQDLTRTIKTVAYNNGSFSGNTIHLNFNYGATYSGCMPYKNEIPTGEVQEWSPFLKTYQINPNYDPMNPDEPFYKPSTLPIQYIDIYGAYRDTETDDYIHNRLHSKSTKSTTKVSLHSHSRFLQRVIDGMKYLLSYIPGGLILRNQPGKILRNQPGKILRGDDF